MTVKLIDELNGCFTNNGNARFIYYKGAEKLLDQFRKDELIDFMQWLIDEKYCLENPIEDCVNNYIKLTKQQ